MLLTSDEIDNIARRAQWYFDVQDNHINIHGDSYIVTGDGVDDLDRLLGLFPIYPRIRVSVDVGGIGASNHRPCDITDVQAIRAAFVGFYGEVNRVPATVRPPSAFET